MIRYNPVNKLWVCIIFSPFVAVMADGIGFSWFPWQHIFVLNANEYEFGSSVHDSRSTNKRHSCFEHLGHKGTGT